MPRTRPVINLGPDQRPQDQITILEPRRETTLGDLNALANDITDNGLNNPIVVTRHGVLLAGERRLRALRSMGHYSIPVITVTTSDEAVVVLEKQRLDGETTHSHVTKDMTPLEVCRAFQPLHELIDLPTRRLYRQIRGRVVGSGRSGGTVPTLVAQRDFRTRVTGYGESTFERLWRVYRIGWVEDSTPQQRELARDLMAGLVDGSETVAGAYHTVTGTRAPGTPSRLNGIAMTYRQQPTMEAGDQLRSLESAAQSLVGMALGLSRLGALHPGLDTARTTVLAEQFATARTEISRLARALKAHSEGSLR